MERWLEQNPWPIVLCVTLPFALIGVYLIYQALMARRLVSASRSWPTTTGRVLSSGVETMRRRRSVSRASTYTIVHYPQIIYEYQINGQVYQGSALNIAHRVGEGNLGDAEAKAAQYPVGATVQVYYNPDDPTEAALNQSAPFNWVLMLVGIGLIAVMLFVWLTVGNPAFTAQLNK